MPMPSPTAYPKDQIDLALAGPAPELTAVRSPLLVGFDGSLTAFGWGVVTIEERPVVRRVGCVTTKPDHKSAHTYAADKDGARVDEIANEILRVLDEALSHRFPVLVAIEAPAGSQHAVSAKALGLAYGISRTACAAKGLIPITIQAFEVRRALGGSDRASYDDMVAGIRQETGWASIAKTKPVREGESDAVGVALTAMRHPLAAVLRQVRA